MKGLRYLDRDGGEWQHISFRISDRIFNYSHTVGRREYKGSGFRHPIAFALGKDGVVYVLSRAHEETVWYEGGRRVTMLTLKEEFVGEFGKYGDGDGEFRWPTSIALDSQQNLYLSDEWLRRVSIYDPRGNFLSKWEVPSPNADTPGAPTNLVFDGDDNLYVVDRTGNCVQVFTKDGKFLHRFGSQGTGPGQFDMPWGISIDPKRTRLGRRLAQRPYPKAHPGGKASGLFRLLR